MKWLHNILKASTLTTALFIFQACYGTPQGLDMGVTPMTFVLEADKAGTPLEGIKILANRGNADPLELGITDADGRCSVQMPFSWEAEKSSPIRFEDPSGKYAAKDTTFEDLSERDIVIKLIETTNK